MVTKTAGVAALTLLLAGCNLIFAMDEGKPRPEDDGSGGGADGAGGAGGAGGAEPDCRPIANYSQPWECLDEIQLQRETCATELVYQFRFVTLGDTSLEGADVSLKVCDRADDACAEPLQTLYPDVDSGEQLVFLPATFDGYLDIDSAIHKGGIIELGPPTTLPQKIRWIPLVTQTEFEAQLATATPPIFEDPKRASLLIGALNCAADYQNQMKVDSPEKDGETDSFYLGPWFFGFALDATAEQTGDSGAGGFVNMPLGTDWAVTIRTVRSMDNRVIGEALGVKIRPSELTYVHLGPTP